MNGTKLTGFICVFSLQKLLLAKNIKLKKNAYLIPLMSSSVSQCNLERDLHTYYCSTSFKKKVLYKA